MNKEEYRLQLATLLYSLPEKEREEAVAFYMEMITDRMDEGMSEEEAIAAVSSPGEAAQEIIAQADAKKQPLISFEVSIGDDDIEEGESETGEAEGFMSRLKTRRLSTLEWVALIVTSPLWLSLLLALAAVALALIIVIFALYLSVWVVVACVWVTGVALVAAAPVALVIAVWGAQISNIPYALEYIGYALFAFGGGMWTLRGALKLTRAFYDWTKRSVSLRFEKDAEQGSVLEGADLGTDDGVCAAADASLADDPIAEPRFRTFFKVCTILIFVGLGLILLAFVISGFDWRIFLTSSFSDGRMYFGGVEVTDPDKLLFSPFAWFVH